MENALRFMEKKTGLIVKYMPKKDQSVTVRVSSVNNALVAEAFFLRNSIDEARILYAETTQILRSRAYGNDSNAIKKIIKKLFSFFRGEKISFTVAVAEAGPAARDEFIPNPGKKIEIDVDGRIYRRLPVRTRLITPKDTDILPLVMEYVEPHIGTGDILFISEKVLTITQGRVIDMSAVKPTWFARFLARHVSNYYGTKDFRGFGHGTAIAMQVLIEETGYFRVVLAAALAAVTRPLGIHGLFYLISGKQAKSIDCPMSFLILEYAHSVKLPPSDPTGAAKRLKKHIGCDVVILDANYQGAFSLGKSGRISEKFISKLFRDNPMGQMDEMTPFCIVRKK